MLPTCPNLTLPFKILGLLAEYLFHDLKIQSLMKPDFNFLLFEPREKNKKKSFETPFFLFSSILKVKRKIGLAN